MNRKIAGGFLALGTALVALGNYYVVQHSGWNSDLGRVNAGEKKENAEESELTGAAQALAWRRLAWMDEKDLGSGLQFAILCGAG